MPKISSTLQKAVDSLSIYDVYIRATESKCREQFDPKFSQNLEGLIIQQMHLVAQSSLIKVNSETTLLRILIKMGTRWISPEAEDGRAPEVEAQIEADFIVEYQINEELHQESIDEFSLKNASFHVWPYWREYLSSQCERLRLPRVILPTVQFTKNGAGSPKGNQTPESK